MPKAGDRADASPESGVARLLVLLGALLFGVAVAMAAMPTLFRATPTDLSRLGVLLAALADPDLEPEVAVLGNSVLMSGVDGRQLAEELPGRPVAINLASTGQSLVESYLLQQELPSGVRAVVQLVTASANAGKPPLEAQKYNTFYMYGFRPTQRTRETLGRIFDSTVVENLDASGFSQRFRARWALRQFVDTQLRGLLRRDLSLASADQDLFHPQRYTRPIDDYRLERVLGASLGALAAGVPEISSADRELVKAMVADAAERGASFTILFPPLHPRILSAEGDRLAAALDDFRRAMPKVPNLSMLDASRVLEDRHFIDDRHPTDEGAAIVTRLLAKHLAAAN